MDALKPVAMYREQYKRPRPELPSIADAFTGESLPDRSRIASYLDSGTYATAVMEATHDIFGGSHIIPGGPSLITDGTWLWRVDSVHYAAHYPLRFDPEFVAFVRAHDYTPPEVELTDELYEQIDEYFGSTG